MEDRGGWPTLLVLAGITTTEGCPILAFCARVGTTDRYFLDSALVRMRSLPLTLSHRTRKDGAPTVYIAPTITISEGRATRLILAMSANEDVSPATRRSCRVLPLRHPFWLSEEEFLVKSLSARSKAPQMITKSAIPNSVIEERLGRYADGHRTIRINGIWSAKITAMIAQNQMCLLKSQWSLMANIVIPKTMKTVSPISALPSQRKSKNKGPNMTAIMRPVGSTGSFSLRDS